VNLPLARTAVARRPAYRHIARVFSRGSDGSPVRLGLIPMQGPLPISPRTRMRTSC